MNQHGLLVVGSVALDSVETTTSRRDEILGGSASFFSTAAGFFCPVNLVAVVGEDFPEAHVSFLREHGVNTAGLSRVPGRTFRWSGRYSSDFNQRTTLDTQLNVFDKFSPDLPASFRDARLLFLGNIHPELQLKVLEQVHKPQIVAMDTMNFWIEGSNAALRKVLRRIDFLLVNEEEAKLLSGHHNLVRAAQIIQEMGVRSVVVKRGDSGALLFHDNQVFAAPALPLSEVIDPTGAGDSFAGGFMGYLERTWKSDHLDGMTIRRAMICGSAMASFCCEDFSLDRFKTLTTAEMTARFQAFGDLTHFDKVNL